MVWVQNVVTPDNTSPRIPVAATILAGGVLGSDNTLVSQLFVALNQTGLTIHEEATFTITFEFVREQNPGPRGVMAP